MRHLRKHHWLLVNMLKDYYVSYRGEESIAQLATRLRDAHVSRFEASFDIIDFVEQTLPRFLGKKRPLKIVFYAPDSYSDSPAHVSFAPLTLNIEDEIWAEAKAGGGYARFVIAHEIGHMVLHDHSAKAFSKDKSVQISFAEEGSDLRGPED